MIDLGSIHLPDDVVDCGLSENQRACAPVCGGKGWYSKITFSRVDAIQVCLDQGYSGTINEYGGNSGKQCKYSNSQDGGDLHYFGYRVSWKCEGNVYMKHYLYCTATKRSMGFMIKIPFNYR